MAEKRVQKADGSVEITTSDAVDRSRLTVAQQQGVPQPERPQRGPQSRRVGSDLGQVMPLVERALGVLDRREVQPQVGLLKSTMLQLDSTFTEKAYGASSFTNFVAKLQNAYLVEVWGGEARYMIRMEGAPPAEKLSAKSEEAIPILSEVLETHGLLAIETRRTAIC